MKPLNPYALPDGNVSISFSGGRTSAYMLWAIMEANGGLPDRVRVVFANTGRERPETLDFVAEVNRRWGVGVTWVEFRRGAPGYEVVDRQGASLDGQPFEALIAQRRFLPHVKARFCTQELKIRPMKRFLFAQGWRRWTSAIGIRADEPKRLPKAAESAEQGRFFLPRRRSRSAPTESVGRCGTRLPRPMFPRPTYSHSGGDSPSTFACVGKATATVTAVFSRARRILRDCAATSPNAMLGGRRRRPLSQP